MITAFDIYASINSIESEIVKMVLSFLFVLTAKHTSQKDPQFMNF
jgi:hypothetical protein